MRVLHILHESPLDPRGGLGVHVAGLAPAQVALGAEVIVLGMMQSSRGGLLVVDKNCVRQVGSQAWHGNYRVVHAHNLNRHIAPEQSYNDIANIENYTASILHADRDLQIDVIHLHDAYLLPVAVIVAAWQRCPIVVTVHLSCTLYATGSIKNRYYRWCCEREVQAYHGAARLITVSQTYAEMLQDRLLLKDVVVIPNGVDARQLDGVGRMFRPREKTAVFIGRLVRQKGVDAILDAAKVLPDWRFIVVASVAAEDEYQYPIAAMMQETSPNVEWIRDTGYSADRWQHVRQGSVALVPSIHEPFGIVALEWMALGVPLITSRVDGLGDFCTDENSWRCDPTPEGIAAALISFERDEDRVAVAKVTAADYSWDRVARSTLEVYDGALRTNTLAA